MEDPKYANLPGIAYGQPDVYETEELPESDQHIDFNEADEENISIERVHLNPAVAINKFRGSIVDGSKVDFSDRITARRRLGYDVRNEWELSALGEPESTYEKFLRLKCEFSELIEEVTKSGKIEGGGMKFTPSHCIAEMKEMESQLLALRLDPNQPTNVNKEKSAIESKIQANVLELKNKKDGSSPTAVNYDLCVTGNKLGGNEGKNKKLFEMEARVQRLENVLGSEKKEKLGAVASLPSNQSVLGSISLLNSRLSLLEPSHVELMESRLTSILQKVNSISEKKLDVQELERTLKLSVLYDMIEESAGMIKALPGIVERLNALKTLHETAATFVQQLAQVQSAQESLNNGTVENEKLLKALQDALEQLTTTAAVKK